MLKTLLLIPFVINTTLSSAMTICYFSLNNEKEFIEMGKFSKKLNQYSSEKIEVKEFLSKGGNPHESFEKMVNSGEVCDGLVISGHHTGSFGGKRASGSLGIDFMEKLSCDPKHKDFFSNVKALWLQGCRTLGVGKIEAYESADFHTERVGAVLDLDHLNQSFAELNMEFSATLDQDNPLSSRYLRLFPRATTFGWTKTAPGEKSRSEYSIPFHIAHIAKINDDRGQFFDNPVSRIISKESLIKYVDALISLLGTDYSSTLDKECFQKDEESYVNAWINHGKNPEKFGYDNADLNAYPSLFKSDNKLLKEAKSLECVLKNTDDFEKLRPVIETILKSEVLIGYGFNSIHELMQRYKRKGSFSELKKLQAILKGSEELNSFLMRKLASSELGILRKIDYYAFYSEMTGKKNENIEKLIKNIFFKIIIKPHGENDYNSRDFKQTLMQSMVKHGFIDKNILKKIIESDKINLYTLRSVAMAIKNSKFQISGASEVLLQILENDKTDWGTVKSVLGAIRNQKFEINEVFKILSKVTNNAEASSSTLGLVANVIGELKTEMKGSSEMLFQIIKHEKADWVTIQDVLMAIGDSKNEIEGASEILSEVLKSNKTNMHLLHFVANTIGVSSFKIKGGSEMLREMLVHERANSGTVGSVATAIGYSKFKIKGASGILWQVLEHSEKGPFTVSSIAHAISNSKFEIKEASEILFHIIENERASFVLRRAVAIAIGDSKFKINGASKILSKMIEHDGGKETLDLVANAINKNRFLAIEEKSKLLKKIEAKQKKNF